MLVVAVVLQKGVDVVESDLRDRQHRHAEEDSPYALDALQSG